MSMNLFLQAFTQQELDAMEQDPSLVDQWVWDEKRCTLETDIGNAWDVLQTLLSGAGFAGGRFIDDVLSNGGEALSVDQVKQHAERLSQWQPEAVLEGLRTLEEGTDLYHLEIYQEEEEDLLEEFGKLTDFYRKAADQGLAVLLFAA